MTVLHPTFEEERDLVQRMRAGDEHAFQSFAEHYAPALYRFASSRLPDRQELAREVVQITLCKFMETLESYRGEASLFTWLCAFCRNEIAGHFRRAKRAAGDVPFDEAMETNHERSPSHDPELQLLDHEKGRLVHVALDDIPSRYAEVLEWKYVEALPATRTGRCESTADHAARNVPGTTLR